MAHPYWPLFDLRVRTPRLEVRLPRDEELAELAALAAAGVHDPETMPFAIPWTDAASPELEREALRWWWRQRAEWVPGAWTLTGGVFEGGRIVGVQDLSARDFATTRVVKTGSWLGMAYQGRGIGTEMRAAVLHLAFAGLGALEAHSAAWHDNPASLAVSRKLGYRENGCELTARRGRPERMVNLRLERDWWTPRDDITIEGLEPCRELFGLSGSELGA